MKDREADKGRFAYVVQIKYSELPQFSEVMAAGTAAALVPIRSITRRTSATAATSIASAVGKHERLSGDAESEIVTFLPAEREEAGDICSKLIGQLQGIQLGRVKDQFGWNFAVSQEDGTKVVGESKDGGADGQTVDQLD